MRGKDKLLRLLDILALLVFAGVTFYLVWNHEAWRDEAQTWLLVTNQNLPRLLLHDLRYQCHPMLWYLILFPFAKLGFPFFFQSVLNWLLAIGAAALVVFRAPFPRLTRYAVIFSYLMMFEYAVVARNYALGAFVMFLIASLYGQRFRRPILYAFLVALLFQTHYLLFMAAFALAVLFAGEARGRKDVNLWPPLFIMGASGLVMLLLAYMPADHFYHALERSPPQWSTLKHVFGYLFVPLDRDVALWLLSLVGFAVMGAAVISLLPQPPLLGVFLAALGWMFAIFVFRYQPGPNHIGLATVLLLFTFWVRTFYPDNGRMDIRWPRPREIPVAVFRRFVMITMTCLFFLSIRYVGQVFVREEQMWYSGAKAASQVIRKISENETFTDRIIVACPASYGASVAVYLPERQFWYADSRRFGTYWANTAEETRNHDISQPEIIKRAGEQFQDLNNVLFIFKDPLPADEIFGIKFLRIAAIENGIWAVSDERYYIYVAVP